MEVLDDIISWLSEDNMVRDSLVSEVYKQSQENKVIYPVVKQ